MRVLKAAVVAMGVLIVAGMVVIVVAMMHRLSGSPAVAPQAQVTQAAAQTTLDEPAGTRVAGIAVGDRELAVQLQGGGPDRVVVVDVHSGRVVTRASLAR
jgi:hypothetical protein